VDHCIDLALEVKGWEGGQNLVSSNRKGQCANKKDQRKEVKPNCTFLFDIMIEIVEMADFNSSFLQDAGTVKVLIGASILL
jgi:hypothetical protein